MSVRILNCLVALFIAPVTLAADTLTIRTAASWSFSGTGANGSDYSFSSAGGSSQLLFDLSAIPVNAAVLDATLNVIPSAIFHISPSDADSGCLESGVIQLTQFIEANTCSEVRAADFLDTVNLDGSAPGVQSLNLNGPPPVSIDPHYIHPGRVLPVTLFGSASATFVGWYDPEFEGQTPPVIALSGEAEAAGELAVDYVLAPEPHTGAIVCLLVGGLAVHRFRRRKCPAGNGTNSRCIV